MHEQTPTSGPHESDIPAHAYAVPVLATASAAVGPQWREAVITISTNELAEYPGGTTIIMDEERYELIKRVQIEDGTRVVLAKVPDLDDPDSQWEESGIEVARSDHDEPLWQVAVWEHEQG